MASYLNLQLFFRYVKYVSVPCGYIYIRTYMLDV